LFPHSLIWLVASIILKLSNDQVPFISSCIA